MDLSIEALARELDVAPTVISRFAAKVGAGGFRALRLRLAEELGADRAAGAAHAVREADGAGHPWAAARASLLEDIAILERHVHGIDASALAAAARLLAAAPRGPWPGAWPGCWRALAAAALAVRQAGR